MDFNEEKIIDVLQNLETFFKNPDSTSLATVEFPKNIPYRSQEWLTYIFYSCLLDYGVKSKNYHQNLITTYQKYPEIFIPQYVINNYKDKKEELLTIIKTNIHPRYPNVATEKWFKLSYELSKHKNLLTSIKNISSNTDLNLFVKSISGYGQKTGGLLLRLIYESEILIFKSDLEQIPLDRHDIEISYLNGITKTKNLTPKQIENLSKLYIKHGKSRSIKAADIDKYLWEIGNRFCNSKKCIECPLSKTCKRK